MKIQTLLFFAFGILIFAGCNQNRVAIPPNIVIINIDDMGWRDVGFMGTKYYETPNIDQLASEGITFTNGYASAANCAPSRACLMTGKWTPRHGIFTVGSSERGESRYRKLIPVENIKTLDRKIPVFPEILDSMGYSTCHAGKWHLSENPENYGFDLNIGGSHAGHPRSYYPPYRNVDLETETNQYLTDLIMQKTLDFIDTTSSPFLLYYSPYAVHTPIHPIDSLLRYYQNKTGWNGQDNAEYATMIDNLDRNIGLLISMLKEKDLYDNTFILFTSDNGGLFGITNQHPLRAGKGSYYEGGIRVPFSITWPEKIEGGKSTDFPVSNLDVFPTILEVSGANPANYDHDGMSLFDLVVNDEVYNERPLFWHFPVYLQAYDPEKNENRDLMFRTRPGSVVRLENWKLHYYYEDEGIELYNLKDDIGERFEVSNQFPEIKDSLFNLLQIWLQKTDAPLPVEKNPEFIESMAK